MAPVPSELAYRRQGSSNNGVLLIAARRHLLSNAAVIISGFVRFTATDNETSRRSRSKAGRDSCAATAT